MWFCHVCDGSQIKFKIHHLKCPSDLSQKQGLRCCKLVFVLFLQSNIHWSQGTWASCPWGRVRASQEPPAETARSPAGQCSVSAGKPQVHLGGETLIFPSSWGRGTEGMCVEGSVGVNDFIRPVDSSCYFSLSHGRCKISRLALLETCFSVKSVSPPSCNPNFQWQAW